MPRSNSKLLLVVDIGNTNIVFGVYREDTLINHWRLSTVLNRTSDEYFMLLSSLIHHEKIKIEYISGVIISCVVPPLLKPFYLICSQYIHVEPLIIEPGIKTGMPILYDNPQEVGADRIVNAVAGFEKHKKSLIIVDFGTATTFDYVTPKGEYVGGAIAPGIGISLEALFMRTSKLSRVELVRPKDIIGRSTVTAMQSGIFYGYVSLVDGIVTRIKDTVRTGPYVIATGGLASLVAEESKCLDEVDEFLTLKGLRILYDKNKDYHKFK
jgi:type III pantothenate kinase